MALDITSGQTVRITISRNINRESARKTLERLFMKDHAIHSPLEKRSRNFKELPKRRGGQIWTKRPNKLHPALDRGTAATIRITPQAIRDLNSVESFVSVSPA
ncbi:MAG TPA: hypothetical protein VHY37_02380 [Tepidisphaeraceae bacterium]|jgi:hypothetical protein|nr:hypothetical protein [Tepidisphaeraceae bacterium]